MQKRADESTFAINICRSSALLSTSYSGGRCLTRHAWAGAFADDSAARHSHCKGMTKRIS